ncbi:MAG TPA: hypothetical protein VMZ28_12760 [Kofleriaceae bacterium]|nr:hypothetical protein [Kofleriaceae bacterium]
MPSREPVPWYARAAAAIGALAGATELVLGGYLLYVLSALFVGSDGGADELVGFLGAFLLLGPACLFLVLGWAQLFAAWYTLRGARQARLGLCATLVASAVVAAKSRMPGEAIAAAAAVLALSAVAALIAYRA